MSDEFEVPAEIDELMNSAYFMEEGATKISLMEEAVRHGDMTGNVYLQYELRSALIQAAVFGGRADLALVAFTWCLATNDAHPGEFDEHDLLWKYKWIVDALPDFSSITRQQIEGALADMQRRFEEAGLSMHAVETMRWKCAQYMGNLDEARRVHSVAAKMKRDSASDCIACVYNADVELYATLGDHEASVKAADKVLSGKVSCAEVPDVTYAHLLAPLFHLGRLEQAMELHRKGYRMVKRNPKFVQCFAEHAMFLALTDNDTKAMTIIGTHLADALVHPAERARLDFLTAALFALMSLQAKGKKTIKLRVQPTVPFANGEGAYAVDDLVGWFKQNADALAERFDTRNGNSYFSQRLEGLSGLLTEIKPFAAAKPKADQATSEPSP